MMYTLFCYALSAFVVSTIIKLFRALYVARTNVFAFVTFNTTCPFSLVKLRIVERNYENWTRILNVAIKVTMGSS